MKSLTPMESRFPPGQRVRRWLVRWLGAFAQWRLRARAHRDLASLDAYMLRDIGMSHHAAAVHDWRRA